MATRKKKSTSTKSTSTKKKAAAKQPPKAAAAKKVPARKATRKKAARKTASKKTTTSTAAMTPPAPVRAALKKGLELRKDYGGKGLVDTTIAWARKLAKGAPITPAKARKMHAYFARHIVDKRKGWDNPPTPGYVAWLLWGGDAARTWIKKVLKVIDAKQ